MRVVSASIPFDQCIYNLLYLGLGYRLAAFVALKFMNKEKQRAA